MKKNPYGYLQKTINDLESWTLDQARARGDIWINQGQGEGNSPTGQWAAWNNWLPLLEKRWKEGDSLALLEALAICAKYTLPMPPWCGDEVLAANRKVGSFEARSWSDLFPELHKGRRLHDLKRESKIKQAAINEVLDIRERGSIGEPITDTFCKVGDKYAVSMEKLRQWYYDDLKKFPVTYLVTDRGTFKLKTGEPFPECSEIHGVFRFEPED
jgi:hypothetical protein